MSKYKVGDKVRVRSDLEEGKLYYTDNRDDSMHFTQRMTELRGKVVTIIQEVGCSYLVDKFNEPFFTDEMFEGLVDENMFTKKDLKEFDIVKLRNGKVFMVFSNKLAKEGFGIYSDATHGCHKYFEEYNDDLTSKDGKHDDDIVAVEHFKGYRYTWLNEFFNCNYDFFPVKNKWDWERKEVKEMTVEEIEKELGYKVKVVGNRETT